jgi:hypothetical protein
VRRLARTALAFLAITTHSRASACEAPRVRVTIDTSEAPEVETWAKQAKALVEEWYPKVSAMLPSPGFSPPAELTLVFKKDMKGVAEASGNRIRIAADWVKKHPEDKGMVIHEMTHVIQSYPPSRAGWLVEGVADHVRFFRFEPETKVVISNPDRASYRDGYRTTARFLDWVQNTYDGNLLRTLNAALRRGEYNADLFRTATSKSLDELWGEFVKEVKSRGR